MEAQGYRDSQTMATAKTTQSKKKIQEIQINYDNLNKDCCGALVTMSKKSVERAAAHIKTDFSIVYPQKDTRPPNIFVRPMLPKIISRTDKISPKKDNEDAKELPSPSPVKAKESPAPSPVKTNEFTVPSPIKATEFTAPSPMKEVTTPVKEVTAPVKDVTAPVKEVTAPAKDVTTPVKDATTPVKDIATPVKDMPTPVKDMPTPVKDMTTPVKELTTPMKFPIEETSKINDEVIVKIEAHSKTEDDLKAETDSNTEVKPKSEVVQNALSSKEQSSLNLKNKLNELVKPKTLPSLKFRRQSLEVMKNPIINKNITDFTKSGLKTKILVIKPINRNKDGKQTFNTPLKFQTIKLKDPNKRSSKDDKDQVVVVKVPKVDCALSRPVTDVSIKSKEQLAPASSSKSTMDISTPKENESIIKSVENNDETSTVVPPCLEASSKPTEVEECASNDITTNDDPKVISTESSTANDDTSVPNIIEEPVTDIVMDTSENVNTTE